MFCLKPFGANMLTEYSKHQCADASMHSVSWSGTADFSALDRGCNFSLLDPLNFDGVGLSSQMISSVICPIHLNCHLNTPKNILSIFLLWLGCLDYDLNCLVYELYFIHETYNFYKLELINSLVSLTMFSHNHQKHNNGLIRPYFLHYWKESGAHSQEGEGVN